MICLNSKIHLELKKALSEVQNKGDSFKWEQLINDPNNGGIDGFLAFMKHPIYSSVFSPNSEFQRIDDLFLCIDQWKEQSILNPMKSPKIEYEALFVLWDKFSILLKESLHVAYIQEKIPSCGGLLAYLCGLSKCLVIDYKFSGEIAEFQVISVIDKPQSLFDFWETIEHADMKSRNYLKRIISTGHKIVWHRGVITHIDRRKDTDVFGPSIDTLLMAEILNQNFFEFQINNNGIAMEIGTGNGLISASIFTNYKGINELIAIDVNPKAIECTLKTINITSESRRMINKPKTFYVIGNFDPELFHRRFDLIVCNPPYIPIPPDYKNIDSDKLDYYKAVGGTKLLKEVIKSSKKLLAPKGRLLIMVSSLSLDEAINAIPPNFAHELPLQDKGFEVFFDVEAVLHRSNWLEYLLNKKGLKKKNNMYYHELHPMWVFSKL